MLSSAVVLPEAVAMPDGLPVEAFTLLQDLAEWSVLLVDDRELGLEALYRGIQGWPPEYRHLGTTLLDQLGRQRRLLRKESPQASEMTCSAGCDALRSLVTAVMPERVFHGQDCAGAIPEERDVMDRYIDVKEYTLFRMYEQERLRSPREFTGSAAEIRRLFLEPALRFARTVIVYDRYVGRHLQNARAGTGRVTVHERWSQTLRWIASVFLDVSREQPKELTIVTGLLVDDDLGPELDALARFRDSMQATCGLPVRVHVVREVEGRGRGTSLRHQRFLVTEHAAYQVDPGFDFLVAPPQRATAAIGSRGTDGEIVPTVVARFAHAATIATEHLSLPALPLATPHAWP